MVKKINILGSVYNIIVNKFQDDPLLQEDGAEGYCNPELKEIVICDMNTYPGFSKNPKAAELNMKDTLRHEIIHAFLYESGLYTCAGGTQCWALNEEMVDWLALQAPKIFKAFKEANII